MAPFSSFVTITTVIITIITWEHAFGGVTDAAATCDWSQGKGDPWACAPCGLGVLTPCSELACGTYTLPSEAQGATCQLPALASAWTCCNNCEPAKNSGVDFCTFTIGTSTTDTILIIGVVGGIIGAIVCCCCCYFKMRNSRRRAERAERGSQLIQATPPIIGYGTVVQGPPPPPPHYVATRPGPNAYPPAAQPIHISGARLVQSSYNDTSGW